MDQDRLTRTKTRAAAVSIASNSILILVKIAVGLAMGSISVVAEGLHSMLDLVAAIIAFFGIRIASRPPDTTHPFGHGKAESVSASIEGGLIFLAAAIIVVEAGRRIRGGLSLELLEVGMGVMLLSVVVNITVSRYLFRVARRTDSVALEADAWHLTTDVYTSLGVLVGLGVVRLTGFYLLDPLIAIGVAGLIVKAAWDVTRRSWAGLLDERLPADEESIIAVAIMEHGREMVGFHELRTRKSGNMRYIDLHLVLDKRATLEQAHNLCDHLEVDISTRLPNAVVNIHCEPPEETGG
ncbi:MAG: cation diffusion facilitator family transporter [Dehalococcoidia bacterium]|nr:cation diffusion facilitator family transporter [Dehalococcoidia bacterium]